MGILPKKFSRREPDIVPANPESRTDGVTDEKIAAAERSSAEADFGTAKQAGVAKMEAAANTWTKWDLVAAYAL